MNTSNDEALALLLRADEDRCQAMLAHDINALEQLLADDIVYTHSSAVVDNKQQYLSAMREGRLRYLGIHPQNVNVRLYGTVAVMNGRAAAPPGMLCNTGVSTSSAPRSFRNSRIAVFTLDTLTNVSRTCGLTTRST